jgi:SAM-dependent methyltransferase
MGVVATVLDPLAGRTAAAFRVAALAAEWDRWHLEHERGEAESAEPTPLAVWRELAKLYLPDLAGARVVDVGCARGGFARYLEGRGAEVTAVDLSPAAVRLARAQLGPGSTVVCADARALPLEDCSFDVAVALETPHHVRPPERVLGELVRVTRPGGVVIVSFENELSALGLSRLLFRLLGRKTRTAPVHVPLTLPGILRELRRLGCEIEGIEGSAHIVQLPGVETMYIRWLNRIRAARYLAAHVCVAARKTA